MKKLIAGLVLAAAALTGCGGSVCGDLKDGYESLGEKAAPCGGGEGFENLDTDECEASIDECSDSEKEAISDFSDCLKDLDKCDPNNAQAFISDLTTCGAKIENVTCGG